MGCGWGRHGEEKVGLKLQQLRVLGKLKFGLFLDQVRAKGLELVLASGGVRFVRIRGGVQRVCCVLWCTEFGLLSGRKIGCGQELELGCGLLCEAGMRHTVLVQH